MFDWLQSKPDHPMYSPEEAARLLGDLSKAEPNKTLAELTSWLTSVKDTPGFRPDARLGVVGFLDQAAQPHERKVMTAYLAQPHLREVHGKQHWQLAHEFWSQLADAYCVCLAGFRANAKAASAAKDELPVPGAREIRARVRDRFGVELTPEPVLLGLSI